MGTIECSQPASKSSWDSQDFGDISMVLKMAHFRKSIGPQWVKSSHVFLKCPAEIVQQLFQVTNNGDIKDPIQWIPLKQGNTENFSLTWLWAKSQQVLSVPTRTQSPLLKYTDWNQDMDK